MTQLNVDPTRMAVSVDLIREIDAIEEQLVANRLRAFLEVAYERQFGPEPALVWVHDAAVQQRINDRALHLTVAQSLAPQVSAPPSVREKRADAPTMFFVGPDHELTGYSTNPVDDVRPRLREHELDVVVLETVRAQNLQWARETREQFERAANQRTFEREFARRQDEQHRARQEQQRQQEGPLRVLAFAAPMTVDPEREAREQAEARQAEARRGELDRQAAQQRERVLQLEREASERAEAERQLRAEQAQRELTLQEQARLAALEYEQQLVAATLVHEQLELQRTLTAKALVDREVAREQEARATQEQALAAAAPAGAVTGQDLAAEAERAREVEQEDQQRAAAADAERWDDLAAWEASRRVARAESEIEKIVESDLPEAQKAERIGRWVEYANRDDRMVGGLRQPGAGNGRTTAHYAPLVRHEQVRDVRAAQSEAQLNAKTTQEGRNPLLAAAGVGTVVAAASNSGALLEVMQKAVAAGQGLVTGAASVVAPGIEQGLQHPFEHRFEPEGPPGTAQP